MPSIPTPKIATCDICDNNAKAQVLALPMLNYGGIFDFSGPAVTLRTNNDNSEVKARLTTSGNGRVLVIDNNGQLNRAMVGGNLAQWGAENGWAGIIAYGAVRDSHELAREPIGVKALGTCPRKSDKGSAQTTEEPITIGGTMIKTGMWVTADMDGIVVTHNKPTIEA